MRGFTGPLFYILPLSFTFYNVFSSLFHSIAKSKIGTGECFSEPEACLSQPATCMCKPQDLKSDLSLNVTALFLVYVPS